MAGTPSVSIPLSPIRVCPEHLCKLFNEHGIWERAQAGELNYRVDAKQKTEPFVDRHGNVCTHTELLTVWDDRFPQGDHRREVASQVNRHRTMDGLVGGSGMWDPGKGEMQIHGKRYRRFKTKAGIGPHCELCEGGDMIPPEQRQHDSTYRP